MTDNSWFRMFQILPQAHLLFQPDFCSSIDLIHTIIIELNASKNTRRKDVKAKNLKGRKREDHYPLKLIS